MPSKNNFRITFHAAIQWYDSRNSKFKTREKLDANWTPELNRDSNQIRLSLKCKNLDDNCVDGRWIIEGNVRFEVIQPKIRHVFPWVRDRQRVLMAGRTEHFRFSEENEKFTFEEVPDWEGYAERLTYVELGVKLKVIYHVQVTGVTRIKYPLDAVLIVEERRFPVSSKFLSMKSAFFESLFSGRFLESTTDPITLKSIDIENFELFNNLINRKTKVTVKKFGLLLEMSDYLGSVHVRNLCEALLFQLVNWHVRRCDWWSIGRECRSMGDVWQAISPERLRNLRPEFLRQLVECIFEFDSRTTNDSDYYL